MIHAVLAAERGIDLRDDGGGNLHDGNSSQIRRRRECREVAGHSPSEREHYALSIQLRIRHAIVERREHLERLARLTGRNFDRDGIKAGRVERCGDTRAVNLRDIRIGDERRAAELEAGIARELTYAIENAAPDVHRMRIAPEFYAEGAHRRAPCSIKAASTLSAARSTLRSDVSTTASARE